MICRQKWPLSSTISSLCLPCSTRSYSYSLSAVRLYFPFLSNFGSESICGKLNARWNTIDNFHSLHYIFHYIFWHFSFSSPSWVNKIMTQIPICSLRRQAARASLGRAGSCKWGVAAGTTLKTPKWRLGHPDWNYQWYSGISGNSSWAPLSLNSSVLIIWGL